MAKPKWFADYCRVYLRQEPVWPSKAKERRAVGSIKLHSQRWLMGTVGLSADKAGRLFMLCLVAMRDGDLEFLRQFSFFADPSFVRIGRVAIPIALRRAVWARDKGRCLQCGATERLECDHITAVVHGGETTLDNLQLLCRGCNKQKGPQAHERRRMARG